MHAIKLKPIIDIPNEIVGIKLEDTIEATVDFKNDTVEVKNENTYFYNESIETTCWSCIWGYISCCRKTK